MLLRFKRFFKIGRIISNAIHVSRMQLYFPLALIDHHCINPFINTFYPNFYLPSIYLMPNRRKTNICYTFINFKLIVKNNDYIKYCANKDSECKNIDVY
ncbi:hypothetical protein T06_10852 [Trichinella sp. T6]|nr:hypothetical protein T06_10852 [Trichinella sp. T6]